MTWGPLVLLFTLEKSMKIIGTSGNGFLVELSDLELERLTDNANFSYRGSFSHDPSRRARAVGLEFALDDRFERLRKMHTERESVARAARQLRACADMLEPLEDCLVLPELDQSDQEDTPGDQE
jgi:hypothetical protein